MLLLTITSLALLALAVLTLIVLFRSRKPALAHLQGPYASSWIIGNQAQLMQSEAGIANRQWREQFGDVYRFKSCFGVEWLMLNDPKAIAHVLQGQTTTYHLEESLREFLRMVTGKGIIYSDGPDHARQRRLLQPSFNPTFVKGLAPQFAACAFRVTQAWQRLLSKSDGNQVEINMYEWAECLTMETIGQTAFGVRFGATEGEKHELAQAYQGFLSTAYSQPNKFFIALQALVLHMPPWLLYLTDRLPVKRIQALRAAQASSLAFARTLIREKRSQELFTKEDKDILSILTKAGEEDARGKFTRMSEEEIYAQLTTFFVAGYETSCNTLTFAMYEIARNASIQDRLYAEVAEVIGQYSDDTDTLEYHVHEQMPYLQAVVKETLRVHPVVAHGIFKAGSDNIIPLSKPITTPSGESIMAVPVPSGQRVFCSFDGVNKSQHVWGPDADEFKPERWLDGHLDQVSHDMRCGGPYGNLSNFGGGPKTCIAWRFAVIELQAFLAVLVGRFHFKIAPGFSMRKEGCHIVVTPTGRGQERRGPWMPLIIKPRSAPQEATRVLIA